MDAEQTQEVLDLAAETEQLNIAAETVPVSKLELQGEHCDSEKLPVTVKETDQSPLDVRELDNTKETVTLAKAVTESEMSPEEIKKIDMEANESQKKTPEHESPNKLEKLEKALPEVVEPSETILLESQQQSAELKVPEQPKQEADVQMVMAVESERQPEVVKEVQAGLVHEVEAEPQMEAKTVTVEPEKPKENKEAVMAEKPVEVEMVTEKPVGETVNEVNMEKPSETETVKKEVVAVELAIEGEKDEKAEQQDAEMAEEEPVPAPGSLSFALLEQEQTIATLRSSRTLIILKGLPGSGKSLLAHAIADSYKDLCTICCADDHGVKPESPEASADAYKAFQEAVVACCSAGSAASVVVVDDTNHTQDQLALLEEVAEQHRLVPIFLEPRTEWSRDLLQLTKRSRRGLEEAQIQAMMNPLKETTLPLFFGWFLFHSFQDKVRCTSMDFLKTLDTLEAFKKHMSDFTGEAEKEVDLEQYFQPKGALHCTTKFCDYGKAEGAKEYAEIPAVKDLYGSATELSLSALFVTPRTVGARGSLTEDQLVLWPADSEKEAESAGPSVASLPLGSRAHVTLGCAEDVEPVQTGIDLLEILALQEEGQQGELVEMELGSLAYYGKGRWLLSLREPVSTQACFSSFYGRKADQVKKESEKKKKPKCIIL